MHKKIKNIIDDIFWFIMIGLALIVVLEIVTSIIKDIKISKTIKENDVCIKLNKDLYCKKN